MPMTAEDARHLSRGFKDLSLALGEYRFKEIACLTQEERDQIEGLEWELLNASSDLITAAVQLTLDESQTSFQEIQKATQEAKKSVQTLKNVKKIINIATATVGLAAAIYSKDLNAIQKSTKSLQQILS